MRGAHGARGKKQEARGKKQEARNKKLDARSKTRENSLFNHQLAVKSFHVPLLLSLCTCN